MKKLVIAAFVLFSASAFTSCKENICIKCTTIVNQQDEQELCSRNRDERQKFQTDLIKAGYNCNATIE